MTYNTRKCQNICYDNENPLFLVENSLSPAIVYLFSYFRYSALRSWYVNCFSRFLQYCNKCCSVPLRWETISPNLGTFFRYFTNTCYWTKVFFFMKSSIVMINIFSNVPWVLIIIGIENCDNGARQESRNLHHHTTFPEIKNYKQKFPHWIIN